MQKEFIGYDEALALKELGFDELCFGWYHHKLIVGKEYSILEFENCKNEESWITGKHCSAPLYQQAFKWFRHNHNLNPSIMYNGIGQWDYDLNGDWSGRVWDSYEEAELTCLGKLIEIVESKKE